MNGRRLRRYVARLALALERSFPPLVSEDFRRIDLTPEWILLILALSIAIVKTIVFLMVLGG